MNRSISHIRTYKNNTIDGEYLDFYKNGLLQTKKNYKLGKNLMENI